MSTATETAIGEAKGTLTPVGLPHLERLERLEHLRGLPPGAGARVGALPGLPPFARSGFAGGLRREADRRGGVEPVDLHRMYRGE
ncbi:hypothetical protein ACFVIN_11455 [Streptomyces prasinus]|uniref:hypothetical protein n=1 Tax=Streptomyces prasinus TaxID=67345 RepID=UPI00363362D4